MGRLAAVPPAVGRQGLRAALRIPDAVWRAGAPQPRRARGGDAGRRRAAREGGADREGPRGPVAGDSQGHPAHPGQVARGPLPVLPPRRDRPPRDQGKGRRQRAARGHPTLRLRRLAGASRPARDDQERLHPPGRGGPDPPVLRGLRRPRDRVPDPVRHGRADRHERVDEPLRQVLHDQEGRAGAPGDGPAPLSPRLLADDRVLHVRQHDERAAAHQFGPQAGEHVRQPDSPAIRPRPPGRSGAAALHQHPRRPAAGAERPLAAAGSEQADHRDHRRRAHRAHRGPRGRVDLPARREDRHPYAGRGRGSAPTRASACRASP